MNPRTCIACRKKGEKKDFLRIVRVNNQLLLDKEQNTDGRGAYLCKTQKCYDKTFKNKKKSALAFHLKCKESSELLESILKGLC
ncbi:YlxR family protein [Candidatus Peregrinibacteria bacterium]|jgi:uncharacterized protein|nr:YlxR family protein [Candidatus Peregrinibacteria bacterium]